MTSSMMINRYSSGCQNAQVKLSMPKEEAATLATYCEEKGYTKAGFIRQAIKEKMERDNQKQDILIGVLFLYKKYNNVIQNVYFY